MRLLIILVILCIATQSSARDVIDMYKRHVTIPDDVKKVACLSNNLTVYIYTLNFNKLLGWNHTPDSKAASYLDPAAMKLPNLGSMPSKSLNDETILRLHPDLILTSDEDAFVDPDAVQKRLGIPVVKIAVDLDKTADVYELLGICLKEQERAKKLSNYSRTILGKVEQWKKNIRSEPQLSVFYAEGQNGLQTDMQGSTHTQVLDFLGVHNVANIPKGNIGGMVSVSIEQVLAWNPQVILVGNSRQGNTYSTIMQDPRWAKTAAIASGKVFRIPSQPFNWFDRPPSPARLLALQWVCAKLYPSVVKIDMRVATQDFYTLFYNRHLTDTEITELLGQ